MARPEALAAVKEKLLADSGQTLVVSAISGLGGLGKSVLAVAIVLDPQVQARFSDGILWVTLGQNPDLASQLGNWVRTLDKSRDSYSVTTLELARDYLHNLLVDQQMLLVVDDVWNAAHADWFRVGGSGCRILVTTREARLERAVYHELDLMTEEEAISLVRQKLGAQWQGEDEAEFKRFAKALGYLPLALDLAANLVQDGLTWADLRQEFEVERRAVALELLDSTEAWEALDEETQRQYSLRACFNLSLKRLRPEQLRQFAWLGVLPEDVALTAPVAAVLWDLPPLRAKKALIELRRRSFLTDGSATGTGELTYRVHDLMHDTARGLIEAGTLPEIQDLAAAHGAFVDRYGTLDFRAKCCGLPKDGYIHRHVIWHLIQSGREEVVHEVLVAQDGSGRNAWFEACEEVGEPGIFVTAISEGWRLAEGLYEREPGRAIGLQCRYALMTATLVSLMNQFFGEFVAAFVQGGFWSVERAWTYVEQMQDEEKIAETIEALATDLTHPLLQIAVEKTRSIRNEKYRAWALSALAQIDGVNFAQLLEAARSIQDEAARARVLSALAQIDGAYFAEALEAARAIQDEAARAWVLSTLAQIDGVNFAQLLEAARSIQDEAARARVLSALAQIDGAYFAEALEAARSIQDEAARARVLSALAQVDGVNFAQLLEAARSIQDEAGRARVLSTLTQVDGVNFAQLLEAARSIQNEAARARVLSALAQVDGVNFAQLLEAARSIQDEAGRARVLSALAQIDGAYFAEALEAARSIQDEAGRARVLSALAQIDGAYFAEALEAARAIQHDEARAWVLSALAQIDSAYFAEALEAARAIQYDEARAWVLSTLTQVDGANFAQLLEAARLIQDEFARAWALRYLTQIDGAYFVEALDTARLIQDESYRALVLSTLTQIDGANFAQLFEAARLIQDESYRAEVLSALAQIDAANFAQLLEAARSIQGEAGRARVLSALAQIDGAYFAEALEAARSIQYEAWRAEALSALAQIDSAYFTEALEAARSIQYEAWRARVLSALAQINSAYFAEALEAARSIQSEAGRVEALSTLAQIDGAYFTEALEAARSIQHEAGRAEALSALAQIDGAYFTEALEAARSIQDEAGRAEALSALVAQIDGAYFTEALEAARSIQHEAGRARVLSALAKSAPETCLPQLYSAIFNITCLTSCAMALRDYLPRLSLATLPYPNWQTHLHLLAHCIRGHHMRDLVTLYPAIEHLGGAGAMRSVVDEMQRVCQQWP